MDALGRDASLDQRVSHDARALLPQHRLLTVELALVDVAAQTERGLRVIPQPGNEMRHLVGAAVEERRRLRLEVQLLHGAIQWALDRAPRRLCDARRSGRTGRTGRARGDRGLPGRTDGAGRSGGAGRGPEIPLRRAADLRPVDVDGLHVAV